MLVNVIYDNPHYEEHNEYTVTLVEAVDCLNGIVKSEWVVGELEKSGEAVIKNGYATTTITDTKGFYCYEPNCGLRFAADDEESFLKHNCPKQLDPKPFRLAEEFADIIRNELTDDELVLVNERNATNKYEKLSCATHDFIDPNQSMLDAMESLNIEVDLDSDKQIKLINEAWWMAKESNFTLTSCNPGDQNNPAVMCEFCQRIDTPIGGDYIMTVSANECRWIDRENHDNEDYAVYWEVYSALGDECVCGGEILKCSDDGCCWGQDGQVCHRPMMERLLKVLTKENQ